MEKRITVSREGKPCYDIVFEKDFSRLAGELKELGYAKRKLCVVTDSHVSRCMPDRCGKNWKRKGCRRSCFPSRPGKKTKIWIPSVPCIPF